MLSKIDLAPDFIPVIGYADDDVIKVAREVFGDFVFEHLLNTAVQEQVIFDSTTVTEWELARCFERG